MTVLDRFEAKLAALRTWLVENNSSSYGIAHGFAFANPVKESRLRRIEEEVQISLPPEYRDFLLRFGDGQVGPGRFHSFEKGLTSKSRQPFPLTKPFLGSCSPEHQCLSQEAQSNNFQKLFIEWELIPKQDGVLLICDYGCAMYGALILNGPFYGRVWILSSNAAYYGPFGGSEALHDEYAPCEWVPTATPKDYSFFEWYESWLDGQLKDADLTER
jgi:hypothetical protein